MTVVVPVPCVAPVQLLRLPLSKPSANTMFVYCESAGAGVTGWDEVEAGPRPTPFRAATVKVYGVPFVRPLTTEFVGIAPTSIGLCATAPTYGVIR